MCCALRACCAVQNGCCCKSIGVPKGMVQILLERNMQFDNTGCKRESHINNGRITRATATTVWKADWTNFETLQTLLSLPLQFQVVEEARMIPFLCAPCVLSEQDDFKQQKSGSDKKKKEATLLYLLAKVPSRIKSY